MLIIGALRPIKNFTSTIGRIFFWGIHNAMAIKSRVENNKGIIL